MIHNRDRPVPLVRKTPKPQFRKPAPRPAPEGLVSADIGVGHPKVTVTVPVSALPFDCVVAEPEPQPPVTLMLVTASSARLSVTIAGKTFRRCMKAIVADGPVRDGQFAVIQGRLGPDGALDEAGLSYTPKPVTTPESEG